MRTASKIFTMVIIAVLLAWEFVPIRYAAWIGGFDLTVNVSSTAGPLRAVRCVACRERREAEFVLTQPFEPEWRFRSVVSEPFDGKPLSVFVTLTGRTSPMGRELSERRVQFLVVIGQLQDGRQLSKLVEIPDHLKSREVSVSLP